jgi:hypothetical protein
VRRRTTTNIPLLPLFRSNTFDKPPTWEKFTDPSLVPEKSSLKPQRYDIFDSGGWKMGYGMGGKESGWEGRGGKRRNVGRRDRYWRALDCYRGMNADMANDTG